MTDLTALRSANKKRWAKARLTRNFSATGKSLVAAKPRYQAVEGKTNVPWAIIAVIHERESSQNWFASLAQGDPWNRVSTHVPAGRGPFQSWEDGAIDALVRCAPYVARNKDWSIGGALTMLEQYNGLGYAQRGVPSPYLWAGTDQYRSGKYIRDGVYDPHAIDAQPGCAGLLLAIMALDGSVSFDGEASPAVVAALPPSGPPNTSRSPRPSISNPSKGSIGAFVVSLLSVIFKHTGK
jgi:lysozyme family protein